MKTNLEKIFGLNLFSDNIMKKYISHNIFSLYKKEKFNGEPLDSKVAKEIAKAIKKWALKNGVTHYSHWFFPLTGKAAEKQVSFLEIGKSGKFIEDFDEKSLIKGETDASSFPNGGERLTFEARGYTVWDYTSPVFIKEDGSKNKVLCIPTAFCSYTGQALDEKTPLLRAVEELNFQSLRVLKLLGYKNEKKVFCDVGAEQEYFLIKQNLFEKRLDLKLVGRAILGNNCIKSQEYNSHYFGVINDEISSFMNDVDLELWKMGISAKLQHNEVAPCQYELVPIYNNVNIASDQNQIIMQIISNTAKKHGFVALFHEKPFLNVNGSGKHINLSLSTDSGKNLFDVNLEDNLLFLTFFISMIKGIDEYYELIRCSMASRGNDLRLGGNEAPPTLISVFIGDKLSELLECIGSKKFNKKDAEKLLDTRVKALPKMLKDYCDRNRTSPIAFGGNKFEFRMIGSSQSIAWPSTCICTILANSLKEIADKLTSFNSENKREYLIEILKEEVNKHKRIIFNGNGFDEEWQKEAKNRGLKEIKDSFESFNILEDDKIIELFKNTNVLDKNELSLREITSKKAYYETVIVEAKTLVEMINKDIYPTLKDYSISLSTLQENFSKKELLQNILNSMDLLYKNSKDLEIQIEKINVIDVIDKKCLYCKKNILEKTKEIQDVYNNVEKFIPNRVKPFPFNNDLLF